MLPHARRDSRSSKPRVPVHVAHRRPPCPPRLPRSSAAPRGVRGLDASRRRAGRTRRHGARGTPHRSPRRRRSRSRAETGRSIRRHSPFRRPLHRHRLSSDERAPERRYRPGAAATSSSSSARGNNTRELVATCRRHCWRVHRPDRMELRPDGSSRGRGGLHGRHVDAG